MPQTRLALSYDSSAAQIQSHIFESVARPMHAQTPEHHPVVVIGAGPAGLSLAIDLAQRGQRVLLLDNDHSLSTGSRAICFAKRTLEIFDRLGVGDAMCAKGVRWNVGKVFFKDALVYPFDLLPEAGHERPAFINLQQYYVEAYLAVRAAELPNLGIRWKNTITGVTQYEAHATLQIDTPDGAYTLSTGYVVACDGSRSAVRRLMGLETKGQIFKDRFLIADVKMQAPFPTERWFWFDPPFHPNQSVLLHKQPDDVWRIDFQLGWDADPEFEKRPEQIIPRVRALLGEDAAFELEWASVYTFACQRMDGFRHGRVLFAGDSAHGVSPFGARGANSSVQDADNLGWKLAAVLSGTSPATLLNSYAAEREAAADENILNSTRSTDFITPKTEISKLFRNATLALARDHAFARRLVNSGRLSIASHYAASELNMPDEALFTGGVCAGSPALDAPIMHQGEASWLLRHVGADGRFTLLAFSVLNDAIKQQAAALGITVVQVGSDIVDTTGMLHTRYAAQTNTAYLLRPDQYVCARWHGASVTQLKTAYLNATGKDNSKGNRALQVI